MAKKAREMMSLQYYKKPKWIQKNPIYRDIWNDVHTHNKNFMCCAVGATGVGKSMAVMRMAIDLDESFSIDRVVFTPKEFIDIIRSKPKKGSVIIWDETGVEANARNWYSLKNKLISYITQTYRFMNLIVFYTAPGFNYIDNQIKMLFHATLEMRGRNEDFSWGTFKWVTYNPITGKIYRKHPRYYIDGMLKVNKRVKFKLPPKDFIKQYDAKKTKATDEWYTSYEKQLRLMEELVSASGTSKKDRLSSLYEDVITKPEELQKVFDKATGRVKQGLVRITFKLGNNDASALTQMLNQDIVSGKLKISI